MHSIPWKCSIRRADPDAFAQLRTPTSIPTQSEHDGRYTRQSDARHTRLRLPRIDARHRYTAPYDLRWDDDIGRDWRGLGYLDDELPVRRQSRFPCQNIVAPVIQS